MKVMSEKADVLNSDPSCSTYENCLERVRYEYSNLCDKYKLTGKNYGRQYFYIYGARLAAMKDYVNSKASSMWENVSIKRLADLQNDSGEKCVIIGTLFKHQELKPSILKEISEEFQLIPQQKQTKFFSEEDTLILEDELQRIKLIGNVDVQSSVTGVVCAVLGKQDESGKFVVDDICWAGPKSVPGPFERHIDSESYILLISGIDFAHNSDLMPLRLFTDYAIGWLGDPSLQMKASSISLVIIAGNTIRKGNPDKDGKVVNTEVTSTSDLSTTLKQVDEFLLELSESVDVDLLPGEFDPTNYQLPQQPLHLAMFQKASKLRSLRNVTNPYEAMVDGRRIAGSSGQPVDDILKYACIDDNLSALEATLRWGHYAPTAPDTLACYPYYDKDPFIIDCQPDIYFVGNQESFGSRMVEINHGDKTYKTRIISVPSFSKTNTCALVNINTLDCEPITFKVKGLSK